MNVNLHSTRVAPNKLSKINGQQLSHIIEKKMYSQSREQNQFDFKYMEFYLFEKV